MTLKEFAKRLDAADAICHLASTEGHVFEKSAAPCSIWYLITIEPRRTGFTQQIVSVTREGTDIEATAEAALGAFEAWRTSE